MTDQADDMRRLVQFNVMPRIYISSLSPTAHRGSEAFNQG